MPLAACVRPAAGTTVSTPMESESRLTASAMNDAPPSCVTSTWVMRLELLSASYNSVVCTPGMPNVKRAPICSSA